MMKRQRIYNYMNKVNDDDRQQLALLLIKSGYSVRLGKETPPGKRTPTYYVEYWKEGGADEANEG